LYPDCQPVVHIPGTTEVFSLSAYKQFVGKAYQKITLYICTDEDYVSGKYYTEKFEFLFAAVYQHIQGGPKIFFAN